MKQKYFKILIIFLTFSLSINIVNAGFGNSAASICETDPAINNGWNAIVKRCNKWEQIPENIPTSSSSSSGSCKEVCQCVGNSGSWKATTQALCNWSRILYPENSWKCTQDCTGSPGTSPTTNKVNKGSVCKKSGCKEKDIPTCKNYDCNQYKIYGPNDTTNPFSSLQDAIDRKKSKITYMRSERSMDDKEKYTEIVSVPICDNPKSYIGARGYYTYSRIEEKTDSNTYLFCPPEVNYYETIIDKVTSEYDPSKYKIEPLINNNNYNPQNYKIDNLIGNNNNKNELKEYKIQKMVSSEPSDIDNKQACKAAGYNWLTKDTKNGYCTSNEPTSADEAGFDEKACVAKNYYWYDWWCHGDEPKGEDIDHKEFCESHDYDYGPFYWYNGSCHSDLPTYASEINNQDDCERHYGTKTWYGTLEDKKESCHDTQCANNLSLRCKSGKEASFGGKSFCVYPQNYETYITKEFVIDEKDEEQDVSSPAQSDILVKDEKSAKSKMEQDCKNYFQDHRVPGVPLDYYCKERNEDPRTTLEIKYTFKCPLYNCPEKEIKAEPITTCSPMFKYNNKNAYCVNPSLPFATGESGCDGYQIDPTFDVNNCDTSNSTVDCGYANILIEGTANRYPSSAINLALRLWGVYTKQDGFGRIGISNAKYDSEKGKCIRDWFIQPYLEKKDPYYPDNNNKSNNVYKNMYMQLLKLGLENAFKTKTPQADGHGISSSRERCLSSNTNYSFWCGMSDYVSDASKLLFDTVVGNPNMKQQVAGNEITQEPVNAKLLTVELSGFNNDELLAAIKNSSNYMWADVTGDGKVDIMDGVRLINYLNNKVDPTKPPNKLNADVNLDGYVDDEDLNLLNKYLAGYTVPLDSNKDKKVSKSEVINHIESKGTSGNGDKYIEVTFRDEVIKNGVTIYCNEKSLSTLSEDVRKQIEPYCRVEVQLVDASGKVLKNVGSMAYCKKNYCSSNTFSYAVCDEITTTTTTEIINVKYDKPTSSKKVLKFISKSNPYLHQTMFAYDPAGNSYKPNIVAGNVPGLGDKTSKSFPVVGYRCAGQCTDYEYKSDLKNCEDNEQNFNGVFVSKVKEPSLKCILNMASSTEKQKYDYSGIFGNNTSVCRIYCSDEVEYYIADKVLQYSGRAFAYDIGPKVHQNNNISHKLSSVVKEKRTCVSELAFAQPGNVFDAINRYSLNDYICNREIDPSCKKFYARYGESFVKNYTQKYEAYVNDPTIEKLIELIKLKSQKENNRGETMNNLVYDMFNCSLIDIDSELGKYGVTKPKKYQNEPSIIKKIRTLFSKGNLYGFSNCNKVDGKKSTAAGDIECVEMNNINTIFGPVRVDKEGQNIEMNSVIKNSNTFDSISYCKGRTCYQYDSNKKSEEYNYPNSTGFKTNNFRFEYKIGTINKTIEAYPINDYARFSIITDINFYNNSLFKTKPVTGDVYKSTSSNSKDGNIQLAAYSYPIEKDIFGFSTTNKNEQDNKCVLKSGNVKKIRCPIVQEFKYVHTYFGSTSADNAFYRYINDANRKRFRCYVDILPTITTKDRDFIYRNVDLGNLFPHGDLSGDWATKEGKTAKKEIEGTAKTINIDKSLLDYEITLTPEIIKDLKNVNNNTSYIEGGTYDNCEKKTTSDKKEIYLNCKSEFFKNNVKPYITDGTRK